MNFFISSLNSTDNGEIIIPINPTTVINKDLTKWVVDSRDSIQFTIESGIIKTSNDGGLTFTNSYNTTNVNDVSSSYIFSNGNILLFTNTNKIFLTNNKLEFFDEKIALDINNNPITPLATEENYFIPLAKMRYGVKDDVYAFGPYTNIDTKTDVDINIFYTNDFGVTIKSAYLFSGGVADNPRHVHQVEYSEYSDRYICSTGDNPPTNDILWKWGDFNGSSWIWTDIFGELEQGRMKSVGVFFRMIDNEEWIYWTAENDNLTTEDVGIWRCRTSNFSNLNNHERILNLDYLGFKMVDMFVDQTTGIVIAVCGEQNVFWGNNKILIALDFGHGDWQIKEYNGYSFAQTSSMNGSGYYTFQTNWLNPLQDKTLMIKPGLDLFNNLGYDWSKP